MANPFLFHQVCLKCGVVGRYAGDDRLKNDRADNFYRHGTCGKCGAHVDLKYPLPEQRTSVARQP
jgi:hypothetical protein